MSTSDKLALTSLVVSGFSFFVTLLSTLFSGYQSKRLELKGRRFEKLCLEPVDACFKGLDNLFANNKADFTSEHKETIAESLTEINYLLIQLKSIYPALDFEGIERLCDGFSDLFFESSTSERLVDYSAKYFYTKTQVLNALFIHAIDDQMRFHLLPPVGRWWSRWQRNRKARRQQRIAKRNIMPAASPSTGAEST